MTDTVKHMWDEVEQQLRAQVEGAVSALHEIANSAENLGVKLLAGKAIQSLTSTMREGGQ